MFNFTTKRKLIARGYATHRQFACIVGLCLSLLVCMCETDGAKSDSCFFYAHNSCKGKGCKKIKNKRKGNLPERQ